MLLEDAVTELRYSKDWTKPTEVWYASRLKLFLAWARMQDVTTLEGVTPPLVRRYVEHLQKRPSKYGGTLDSHTVHGHVRIIRTLLFWAASEVLIDEVIPRRHQAAQTRGEGAPDAQQRPGQAADGHRKGDGPASSAT